MMEVCWDDGGMLRKYLLPAVTQSSTAEPPPLPPPPPAGSQIIFRVRRPAYLINSNMTIEDGQGNVVGEVQQRWHLLKRNYDLFMDRQQFAAVRGEWWRWCAAASLAAGMHVEGTAAECLPQRSSGCLLWTWVPDVWSYVALVRNSAERLLLVPAAACARAYASLPGASIPLDSSCFKHSRSSKHNRNVGPIYIYMHAQSTADSVILHPHPPNAHPPPHRQLPGMGI
jgi:hypothetical protein